MSPLEGSRHSEVLGFDTAPAIDAGGAEIVVKRNQSVYLPR